MRSQSGTFGIEPVDFRLLFEAAPTPYLVLRPDQPRFTIAAVNDAYLRTTGKDRAAIIGHGLFEIFPENPDDAGCNGEGGMRASLNRVLRNRVADTMAVRKCDAPPQDGSDEEDVRYWSPVNTPVEGAAGRIDFIIHRIEDVTSVMLAREEDAQTAQRNQAELARGGVALKAANRQLKQTSEQLTNANEELKSAQAATKLSLAMDTAKMGEVIYDLREDSVIHTPGFAHLFGYPDGHQLTLDDIHERCHPDDRARIHLESATAFVSDAQFFEIEHRVVWTDSTLRWLAGRFQIERDRSGEAIEATAVYMDVTERKWAEERQRVLLDELNHRVRNTLSTVHSIAVNTRRGAPTPEIFGEMFEARLMALAGAHDLLTQAAWEGASLADVVWRTLSPYVSTGGDAPPRIVIGGPMVQLSPNAAVTLNMAFHELATNAASYGALSNAQGRLDVLWTVDHSEEPAVVELIWNERGGPPVLPPKRRGFGSRLLEQGLARELDGEVSLRYEPQGLKGRIRLPASNKVSPS